MGVSGIGLKKEHIYENEDIEPIHYVNPNSNEVKDFRKAFTTALANTDESMDDLSNFVSTSLLYMKPIMGEMRTGTKNTTTLCFHDEKEWRYIPKIDENSISLVLKGKMLTDSYKNLLNQALKENDKYWLKFSPEDINYLIVEDENESTELAKFINGLKQKYTEEQRMNIISKILILNNLGKDW